MNTNLSKSILYRILIGIVLIGLLLGITAFILQLTNKKWSNDSNIRIKTKLGDINLVFNKDTPLTKQHFKYLVDENILKGTMIYRSDDAVIGGTVTKEVPQEEFGRIAAQTAKQTLMQQLRKTEKAKVYDEFKENVGNIVSGTVRSFEFRRAEYRL